MPDQHARVRCGDRVLGRDGQLPDDLPAAGLVRPAMIHRIEHHCRECKTVLGLGHSGGRAWSGRRWHVTLVTAAQFFITRLRPADSGCPRLTPSAVLPELRARLVTRTGTCSPTDNPSTPAPGTDLRKHYWLEEELWR